MGGETKQTEVRVKPKSGQDKPPPPQSSSSSKPTPKSPDLSLSMKKIAETPIIKQRPPDSSKSKPTTTVKKTEVKASSSSSKTTKKTTAVKTREKKVYSLPGQKYDVPEEREPLRIFYESLSKQIPSSEMAQFWLMEHGLLPPDKAKRAYEKKQIKQKQMRMGTPIKSPPLPQPRNKPESSNKQQPVSKNGEVKAKKRIMDTSDDDEDDDFILSSRRRKG